MTQAKPVLLTIRGQDEDDVIEMRTRGVLRVDAEGCCLSYQESETSGMEGTRTTLRVRPECVTLCREGAFSSRMVFRPGCPQRSTYATPYGSMTIDLNTRRLRAQLDEHGGAIEVDYTLEIDRSLARNSRLRIDVSEVPRARGEE